MIKVDRGDLERIQQCLRIVYKELERMDEYEDDLNQYVPEEAFLTDEVYTTLELVEELLYDDDEAHYTDDLEDWEIDALRE